jgi:predicted Zn-dependent protease
MKNLPHTEAPQVEAAEGWLMLGDVTSANDELSRIDKAYQKHPFVLAAFWQVCAARHRWDDAWRTARTLCETAPGFSKGWICQANSLRECRSVGEAKKLLVEVVHQFPEEPIIPYNLACFAAQLSQFSEACYWLLQAFENDSSNELKILALSDADLKPLWCKIAASTEIAEEAIVSR